MEPERGKHERGVTRAHPCMVILRKKRGSRQRPVTQNEVPSLSKRAKGSLFVEAQESVSGAIATDRWCCSRKRCS